MSARSLAEQLAQRLGLRKSARSWRGDCPACSYAGAFSVRLVSGSERPLLYCSNGCDWASLNAEAKRVLAGDWFTAPKDRGNGKNGPDRKQAVALRLLGEASAVTAADPAGRYLAFRQLAGLIGWPALHFISECWHPEGGRFCALVASVQDEAGQPIAVHRTYVTPDGRKAPVEPAKASLGPVWGGAIRLAPIAPELVIGEGIETSASAGLLLGLPAWAAISAGNLGGRVKLPPEVKSVVIAADADEPGERAAVQAAERWAMEGRRVRIAHPNTPGEDFNDLLCAKLAKEAGHAGR